MGRGELSKTYSGWSLDERIREKGWYELDHYETADEARARADRVRNWFESETQTHSRNDCVAMVIHADFKLRLVEAFSDYTLTEDRLGDIVNTSISRLSYSNGHWKLDYWNVFQHLEPNEVTF
jgi:2,3-bisphosphoglycerate-dependent phosphoglycerate mutase